MGGAACGLAEAAPLLACLRSKGTGPAPAPLGEELTDVFHACRTFQPYPTLPYPALLGLPQCEAGPGGPHLHAIDGALRVVAALRAAKRAVRLRRNVCLPARATHPSPSCVTGQAGAFRLAGTQACGAWLRGLLTPWSCTALIQLLPACEHCGAAAMTAPGFP